MNSVSVDNLFDNNKNKKPKYVIKLIFTNGLFQVFENVSDVICNDSILAVVFEKKIWFYKMEIVGEWVVNKS